jgi:hypothetical protein
LMENVRLKKIPLPLGEEKGEGNAN